MHFSIEARVQFLDHRLVEATLSLPTDQIIKNGETKYILRESLKDVLPPKIYARRDKKGFSNPREKWFRSEKFQNLIYDIINSERFSSRGYFEPKQAIERYRLHLEEKINISKEIWKWINLETWFQKFVD